VHPTASLHYGFVGAVVRNVLRKLTNTAITYQSYQIILIANVSCSDYQGHVALTIVVYQTIYLFNMNIVQEYVTAHNANVYFAIAVDAVAGCFISAE